MLCPNLWNLKSVFFNVLNFASLFFKDRVGQVLFLASCPKGQVEKYVNVEACIPHHFKKIACFTIYVQ
jgi:hypothetical protein